MQPKGYLYFNKNGYSKYCKEYAEYWDWVDNRNENRYASTVRHGKKYDAKNMMHTFRLLDTAEEIALHNRIVVRRSDNHDLLKIRAGEYSYQELIEKADKKLKRIGELYRLSDLPPVPDSAYAEKMLVSIRNAVYCPPV